MSERKMREDGLGRDPDGSGCRPSDETPTGSPAFGASIPRAGVEALEAMLRSLLQGEHTSLTLGFNDGNACNYLPVGKYLETYGESAEGHTDWVSDEERAKAIATNSWWCAQWYPNTPVGFQSVSAASLPVLVAALAEEAPAIEAGTAETEGLGPKAESAIGKAEAPINSTMLSALKAMDEALTFDWESPDDEFIAQEMSEATREAWIQIRSAISQADGR